MGLFDLFGKKSNEPAKPLEEYLQQRDAQALLSEAKTIIRPDRRIRTSAQVGDLSKYFRSDKCGEAIPRSCNQTNVSAFTLLKMAAEKGSAEAAFYLALLYEHGIGVKADQDVADDYHDLAARLPASNGQQSVGQCLERAVEYIKNGNMLINESFTDEQTEDLAVSIYMVSIVESDPTPQVKEILGNKSMVELFGWVGSLLLCHHASEGRPYSAGMLGETLYNGDVLDYPNVHFAFLHLGSEERKAFGKELLDMCLAKARSGNAFAISMMDSFGYRY